MNKDNKTTRFDYSKIESKADTRYWGIHEEEGRLHIDTKRHKKICESEGVASDMPEGLFRNRSTPYFIPQHKSRHDYRFNIFRDLIGGLRDEWFYDIKPYIEFGKQGRKYDRFVKSYPVVGEPNPKISYKVSPLGGIEFTTTPYEGCDDNPYDEHKDEAGNILQFFNHDKAAYIEKRKLANIFNSLQLHFIQKLAIEVNRALLIVCSELGYKEKDFGLKDFFVFSDGLAKSKKKPKIKTFTKYNAFNLLFKLNNFLKHNTVQAYETLKDNYPDNILKTQKTPYENGMYAADFVYLQADYLDKIFDKLIIFFGEYCKNILGENIEDADWNYDDWFSDLLTESNSTQ
ncbi:MAG: hypothetical protein FWE03_00105 [Firmicutes bacterium]|nr:hypothetical protein [Bacillota bacterium]